MPATRLRPIGKHSIAAALLFAGTVAVIQCLNVRGAYFGTESYVYAAYNLLKTLLFVLLFPVCASLGALVLRARSGWEAPPGIDRDSLLLCTILGVCVLQVGTVALGCAGLLDWKALALPVAAALLFSDGALRFLASHVAARGRSLARIFLASLRGIAAGCRERRPLWLCRSAAQALFLAAFAYQYLILFVMFAIRPNDQVNDIHVVYIPYLDLALSERSTLVPQYLYQFFYAKNAGFNFFVTALGDPYFWQVAMFFLFTVALFALHVSLKLVLPGARLFRLVTLLFFSSSILFKFNQYSLHAAHTYFMVLLAYLFLLRAHAADAQTRSRHDLAQYVALFSVILMEPKLSFFVYAMIGVDALWRIPPGRLIRPRVLWAAALPVAAIGVVFAVNYFSAGMVDVFVRPLRHIENPARTAEWISRALLHIHDQVLGADFSDRHFTLRGLLHGTNRLYGGLEFLAVHLLCGAYLLARPRSFSGVFRYAFSLCSALLFTGLFLATWQSSDGITRFLWILEPASVLLKFMFLAFVLRLLPRKLRPAVVVAASVLVFVTLKPTQSLVSLSWLTHTSTLEEKQSLDIKNYSHKVYDVAQLFRFFARGTFVSAHAEGFFPPGEPYRAAQLMPPGSRALVLNYFPPAYLVPGNVMACDYYSVLNRDFHKVAFASAEGAYAFLRTTPVTYLYLDLSEPFHNNSILLYADLFAPGNIGRYYSVVRKGRDSYLLRLKDTPAPEADPDFQAFYETFYAAAQNDRLHGMFLSAQKGARPSP